MDAGSTRNDGDTVTLQPCDSTNLDQDLSWYGSKLVVDDTR